MQTGNEVGAAQEKDRRRGWGSEDLVCVFIHSSVEYRESSGENVFMSWSDKRRDEGRMFHKMNPEIWQVWRWKTFFVSQCLAGFAFTTVLCVRKEIRKSHSINILFLHFEKQTRKTFFVGGPTLNWLLLKRSTNRENANGHNPKITRLEYIYSSCLCISKNTYLFSVLKISDFSPSNFFRWKQ